MKKALVYVTSFIAAWILMFIVVAVVFGTMLLLLSFVTWSWPVASPFTWFVFRLIATISMLFAIMWSFSKENKEWVDGVMKDLTEGNTNGNS
jgi:hypothetical protein